MFSFCLWLFVNLFYQFRSKWNLLWRPVEWGDLGGEMLNGFRFIIFRTCNSWLQTSEDRLRGLMDMHKADSAFTADFCCFQPCAPLVAWSIWPFWETWSKGHHTQKGNVDANTHDAHIIPKLSFVKWFEVKLQRSLNIPSLTGKMVDKETYCCDL